MQQSWPQSRDAASFNFIDLFCGIGCFRMAAEYNGGHCVLSSEINKFAIKTYEENHKETPLGDIEDITAQDVPDHDVLLAGFPCQPFSSGNVLIGATGFDYRQSGHLFFEIVRIALEKRPRVMVLENVSTILGHDKGNTMAVIVASMNSIGYSVEVISQSSHGYTPQNRKRAFIICWNTDYGPAPNIVLPQPPQPKKLSEYLEADVPDKYTLRDGTWSWIKSHTEKHRKAGNGFGHTVLTGEETMIPVIPARYHKDGKNALIYRGNGNPRKLTPRECARLMTISDDFVFPVSDTQAYIQLGNGIVVDHAAAVIHSVLNAQQGD